MYTYLIPENIPLFQESIFFSLLHFISQCTDKFFQLIIYCVYFIYYKSNLIPDFSYINARNTLNIYSKGLIKRVFVSVNCFMISNICIEHKYILPHLIK